MSVAGISDEKYRQIVDAFDQYRLDVFSKQKQIFATTTKKAFLADENFCSHSAVGTDE